MANEMNLDRLETLLETMEPAEIRAQFGEALAANPDCEALLAQFERLDEDLALLKTDAPTPELNLTISDAPRPTHPVLPIKSPKRKKTPWTLLTLPLAAVVIAGLLWVANVQELSYGERSSHAVSDAELPDAALLEQISREQQDGNFNVDDIPPQILAPAEEEEAVESEPIAAARKQKKADNESKLERASAKQQAETSTAASKDAQAEGDDPAQASPVDAIEQDVTLQPAPASAETAQAMPQREQDSATDVRIGYAPRLVAPDPEPSADLPTNDDDAVAGEREERRALPVEERQESQVLEEEMASLDTAARADGSVRRRDLNQALFYDARGVTVAQSAWLTAWMTAWNDPAASFPDQLFATEGGPYAWPVLALKPVPLRVLRQEWQRQTRPEIRDITVTDVRAQTLTVRVAFMETRERQDVQVEVVFDGGLCRTTTMP